MKNSWKSVNEIKLSTTAIDGLCNSFIADFITVVQTAVKCEMRSLLVRWLGATLCKLGVQAKKLHFHNQESILNNTGYCHILKYGKKILSYFHT